MTTLAEREFELRLAAEGEVMRLRAENERLRARVSDLEDQLLTALGERNINRTGSNATVENR